LGVLENKVLRRLFVLKRYRIIGDRIILFNGELHNS
jgi:hypothetical protein